jgi:Lon protease-like protein
VSGEPPLNVRKILEEFSGEAKLFPLPSVVLFPDTLVPLKVFEPRYVSMVEEAANEDQLLATALLKPGYEAEYEGNPEIHPHVCLGRILRCRQTEDGKFDMLVYGIARARIVREIPWHPYRKAELELMDDVAPEQDAPAIAERLQQALRLIPGRQPMLWSLRRVAEQLRGIDASPGRYVDAMANASDLPQPALYALLAENDVLSRYDLLIHHLRARASEGAPKAVDPADPRLN